MTLKAHDYFCFCSFLLSILFTSITLLNIFLCITVSFAWAEVQLLRVKRYERQNSYPSENFAQNFASLMVVLLIAMREARQVIESQCRVCIYIFIYIYIYIFMYICCNAGRGYVKRAGLNQYERRAEHPCNLRG